MTITFKKITEAREYLAEHGYAWQGFGQISGTNELYEAPGGLVAILRKVPFRGISVSIR